ncbi:uncharacterized protein LOC131365131 [Hemibagrus wyckioides]|uniref:uncharacterized protein LOC131365131 n=1 Tax=Hemibagrus wyckioides TaxID=337641 RepID=UPI00266BB789|nr:uncharacterized protein LOC131365131 [Hemibagrus wyckioides]
MKPVCPDHYHQLHIEYYYGNTTFPARTASSSLTQCPPLLSSSSVTPSSPTQAAIVIDTQGQRLRTPPCVCDGENTDRLSHNPIHPQGQLTEISASAAPTASGVYPDSSISAYKMENNTITPSTLPNLPSGNDHININIIIITVIFCIVCFLLLVAFFYAFCFHCTLRPSPKSRRKDTNSSVDREDATFRRTSSSVSLGNAV